ncbi:MAG: amidohydrolase [Clostridiales bacterium]|nr:amidohydrolase [Clostridiales bacterium]
MDHAKIRLLARQIAPWATDVRRRLHRVPEPGFREEKTKQIIISALNELGIEYDAPRGGWITAAVKGALPGTVTGIRADFDALPITEPEGCPFRSLHEGYMHACGHDLHTAILLGTAKLLCEHSNEFAGKAVLLFEPAEETEGGCKPMVEAGVFEKYSIDRVYGLHVMPRLTVGQVETRLGTLNASTDSLKLRVLGASAHGAYPEAGKDAIVCSAQIVTALQTLVSRRVSPLESAVVTIGKISGGKANNIICGEVVLEGTIRCADNALRQQIWKETEQMCAGIASAMGCQCRADIQEGYPALTNDPSHARRVLDIAEQIAGGENTLIKDAPSMGGEDFAYFLDKAPGAFFHIGCSSPEDNVRSALHTPGFSPDEGCIEIGIAMEAALAMDK